jgi:hypothetical protein
MPRLTHTLAHDRLGDNGGGGRPVADDVVGLDRGFLEQLRAHVLEGVAKVDLPRDGDAVVGHLRCPGDLLQDDVAPLGAERALHCLGELVDARLEQVPGVRSESQFLRHGWVLLEVRGSAARVQNGERVAARGRSAGGGPRRALT